jgi:ubiquinone/menaquinone biosynthesis C-methylase UbiE
LERTLSKLITYPVTSHVTDALLTTTAGKTRRVYDALSLVYPMSTFFFHSKAHSCALEMSGISDGMSVLEVATGSGEMFHRLVSVNPNGRTIGLDLSPNMAARTQRIVRRKFPRARTQCKAVDARFMPFRDESFDAVMCCYLLELLSSDDIVVALQEIYRVLRRRGTFPLVLIGQNTEFFNQAYRVCGSLAPAFWGRQVAQRIPELIETLDFRITGDKALRQGFYPSRVVTARR